LAKLSSIALVFAQSPDESFTPATMPGICEQALDQGSVIATCDTGGM
jgi:hypothetical protein